MYLCQCFPVLYGFVGEKKRDLQAHCDGKVKAVCAYFGSKLEGIQTENAQLLELVKKYKSTADRCQSKLHDLLSRQKSEHDNSGLSVNEYAATKASVTDKPPSLDQMRQTLANLLSLKQRSYSRLRHRIHLRPNKSARHRHRSSRITTRHARKRYALSVFHKKLYATSLSETLI